MKKYVYDIGDLVVTKTNQIAIIIDREINGTEPILYWVLIQTYNVPQWLHECMIKEITN